MKLFIKDKVRKQLLNEVRIPFNMNLPADILGIKDVFKSNGYSLYVVGGAVRDAVLNKTQKDFDLATDAVPDSVERIMQEAGYRTLATGKSFGVINVYTDFGEYEIATFREDSSTGDGRRPDSVTFTNIETDVKRRDLTINALFYDIDAHQVVDLVGGVSDLKKGIVRTVGSPIERFTEDKLRILRAVRFAARFGSELDPEIDAALKRDASLEGISGERIRDEFIKGIKSAKSVVQFLEMLDRYHLFNWIFKGLHVNKEFIEDRNVVVLIAILLKGNNIGVIGKQLNNLKYSVDEVKSITFLLNLLHLTPETAVALKRQQKNAYTSNHQIIDFANREGLNQKLIHAFLHFELTVTGEEVMQQYNLKQGKELGDMINKLELDNFKKSL
jgi:tRNA nucleotidyltransferase/poly(A) polymerase